MYLAITGASGMVGRAAVRRFIERGDQVVAIGRDKGRLEQLFGEGVSCFGSDYSKESLRQAFKGVDVVIHLAARRLGSFSEGARPFLQDNTLVTENVLWAAHDSEVGRVCQASSISVYSLVNRIPFVETEPPIPMSLYGVSKIACEHLAAFYARTLSLPVTSLRIARVLGHDQRTGGEFMLMNFIRLALAKQTLTLWGKGVGARDTVYVQDVVGAIECAVEPDAPGGSFNVGGGRAFSHREIAETVNEVFDNVGNIIFDSSKQEDTSCFFMDCSRAEAELKWQRQWTLKTGLEDLRKQYEDEARRNG